MNEANTTRVGLGTGAIGDLAVSDEAAFAQLDAALALGVTWLDCARSYGAAEARIGAWRSARGADAAGVRVATKGGYGVEGVPDWTGEAVRRGIDDACSRVGGPLAVFFLHSCELQTAAREDILRALEDARRAGKVEHAGYSGEGDALSWAVRSGHFGAVECSVNVFDQANLPMAAEAQARGVLVLAKRALGNAPWRFAERPHGHYAEAYWCRMHAMGFAPSSPPAPFSWAECAMRFSAHAAGVTAALVGTASRAHLEDAVRAAALGPLPENVHDALTARFARGAESESGWPGLV